MDLPLLLLSPCVPSPSPSPSLSHRLLVSQFNSNSLCFKNLRKSFLTQNPSPKIAVIQNSVSKAIELDNFVKSAIFVCKKQLPGPQALIDGLSPLVWLATSAVVVAGALPVGYGLGFWFGGTRATGLGDDVTLSATEGAAVYAMNACVFGGCSSEIAQLFGGF